MMLSRTPTPSCPHTPSHAPPALSLQTMTKSLATLNHVLETMDDVVVAKRGAQLRCHVSDADLEDLRRQGVLYHA